MKRILPLQSLLLLLLVTCVQAAPKPDPSDWLFTNSTIAQLQITLDEKALADLKVFPRKYVRGTAVEGTNLFKDVGVHLKGNYGTFQNVDGKPSITLDFNKFVPQQKFHGLGKLHLNNCGQDPTYVNEIIGREMFQKAGVPVGRACQVTVKLNGRDAGLYVLVEGYDKTFLKRNFGDASGNLYDSEFMHDIDYPLKKASGGDPNDRTDLKALYTACEENDPEARLKKLEKLLDVDRFISFVAMELMIRHFDGYTLSKNNYWLYNDPVSQKFTFIPHGMDQLFFQPQASLFPEMHGRLAKGLLETPQAQKVFRERCTSLFTNLFLGLSNRVAYLVNATPGQSGQIGALVSDEYAGSVSNLIQRVLARLNHLKQHFDVQPVALNLAQDQGVALTNWVWSIEAGKGKLWVEKDASGKTVLCARNESQNSSLVATWQCPLQLTKGTFAVFAGATSEGAAFQGASFPFNLGLWGSSHVQTEARINNPHEAEVLAVVELKHFCSERIVDLKLSIPGHVGLFKVSDVRVRLMDQ
jgi:spore coat protein H